MIDGNHTIYANATDSGGRTGSASPNTVEVQNETVTTSIHIGDLDGSVTSRKNDWKAEVEAKVVDSDGIPTKGVIITASWSEGPLGTSSCTTRKNGTCTLESGKIKNNRTSVVMVVQNCEHSSLIYEPADNSDPDGDSDGTQITVVKEVESKK